MTRIVTYDTTLRDGTQGEGVSLSLQDKLDIARRLDELGIDYVEAGYPGSNPKDAEVFRSLAAEPLAHARPVAFGMTRRAGARAEDDAGLAGLLAAGTEAVALVGKASGFHVRKVLRTDLEENLAMVRDSVRLAKEAGRTVFFDAEHYFDGYKAGAEDTRRVLAAAREAGADWLVLCDTNGGSMPEEVAEIVEATVREVGGALAIHCHNDAGLAVANSLAAVQAGCTQVQGTINGLGERCGNADLCVLIPDLELKMGRQCLGPQRLARLTDVSRFVYDAANLLMVTGQPYVGPGAFAHKGGMHGSAVAREETSYEHVDPARVGNTRRILISELSGRGTILAKVGGTRFEADEPLRKKVLEEVQRRENAGYHYEAAEASFALLLRRLAGLAEPFFDLDHYTVAIKKDDDREPVTEATVKLCVHGGWQHTVAEGDGPVNALDAALRKALSAAYPNLSAMSLTDYKVRVINTGAGTAARVRVVVESRDRDEHWGTVGVSENIIDASWQALVDSFEYKLTKDREKGLGNRD